MPFIKKDYSLAEGKLWTFRGWYRHGLQEFKALIVEVPLVALLAWLLHAFVGYVAQAYPTLSQASEVLSWLCVASVPFSALVFSRFLWWAGLLAAVLMYPVAFALSGWMFTALILAVPFRAVWAAFCHICRNGSAAQYVHVIGLSGWR